MVEIFEIIRNREENAWEVFFAGGRFLGGLFGVKNLTKRLSESNLNREIFRKIFKE